MNFPSVWFCGCFDVSYLHIFASSIQEYDSICIFSGEKEPLASAEIVTEPSLRANMFKRGWRKETVAWLHCAKSVWSNTWPVGRWPHVVLRPFLVAPESLATVPCPCLLWFQQLFSLPDVSFHSLMCQNSRHNWKALQHPPLPLFLASSACRMTVRMPEWQAKNMKLIGNDIITSLQITSRSCQSHARITPPPHCPKLDHPVLNPPVCETTCHPHFSLLGCAAGHFTNWSTWCSDMPTQCPRSPFRQKISLQDIKDYQVDCIEEPEISESGDVTRLKFGEGSHTWSEAIVKRQSCSHREMAWEPPQHPSNGEKEKQRNGSFLEKLQLLILRCIQLPI